MTAASRPGANRTRRCRRARARSVTASAPSASAGKPACEPREARAPARAGAVGEPADRHHPRGDPLGAAQVRPRRSALPPPSRRPPPTPARPPPPRARPSVARTNPSENLEHHRFLKSGPPNIQTQSWVNPGSVSGPVNPGFRSADKSRTDEIPGSTLDRSRIIRGFQTGLEITARTRRRLSPPATRSNREKSRKN